MIPDSARIATVYIKGQVKTQTKKGFLALFTFSLHSKQMIPVPVPPSLCWKQMAQQGKDFHGSDGIVVKIQGL